MDSSLTVRDVMNGVLLHSDVYENLFNVMGLLYRNNGDAVVVRENGAPKGMITSSDIVKTLARIDKSPKEILAREAMTSPILAVEHNADITTARDIMTNQNLRMLAVRQEYDIIGLLIATDLF